MKTKAVGSTSAVLALIALAALPSVGRADETLLCDRVISAVPYTISVPGHYCLRSNLNTAIPSGAAITINASFVWLDLNNFTLSGSGAGTADGIAANAGRRNITVRNGTVRRFYDGIRLGVGTTGANFTVEGIWADQNKANGIAVRATGGGHNIRGNVVTNTGGTNPGDNGVSISIQGAANVIDNQVMKAFGNPAAPGGANGMAYDLSEGPQIVVNNRASAAGVGFICDGSGQYLRDNISVDTPVAYGPGCIKIGSTNFP